MEADEGWLDQIQDLDLTVVPMTMSTRVAGWPDALTWFPPSPAISSPTTAMTYPATVLFVMTLGYVLSGPWGWFNRWRQGHEGSPSFLPDDDISDGADTDSDPDDPDRH